MTILRSENPDLKMSQDELVEEMDHFQNIRCDNCGTSGNWDVLRIQLNDNNPVIDKFLFSAIKNNNQIAVRNQTKKFDSKTVDGVKQVVLKVIEQELVPSNPVALPSGELKILVEILNEPPFYRANKNHCFAKGFSVNEIRGFAEFYFANISKF